jgi:anion transporter
MPSVTTTPRVDNEQTQLTGPKLAWLIIGVASLLVIVLLSPRAGLPVAGQRVLGISLFAVIMWITEAIPYDITSVAIVLLLAILLGFSPQPGTHDRILGTAKALQMAVSGFTSTATILVTAAMLLAAAVQISGLEKRIAIRTLKLMGPKSHRMFAAVILIMIFLDFLIPSILARTTIVAPLVLSLINTLGIDRKSSFARYLLLSVALSASISGIGVLTAGIPNLIAISLIAQYVHRSITWTEWLIYSFPYCIALMLALYFLMVYLNKSEFGEIPGARQRIDEALSRLGPMTAREKRISLISILTILLWATERYHKIDVATVALIAVMLVLLPNIGVATWKELTGQAHVGRIVLIASAALSLGEALLNTGGATWVTKITLGHLGLQGMAVGTIMIAVVLFLVVIRFAFASITSAAATVVPMVLAFLLGIGQRALPILGMVMIATYTTYFAFILPVSDPQNMIVYGTGSVDTKDFMRVGIPLSVMALLLLVLFWCTYWHWLGIV